MSQARRRLLTLAQLLEVVPLKRSRVYYMTHTRQIPFIRIGHTLLFDMDEINTWIDRQKEGPDGCGSGIPHQVR
jgi:excisionase family DNA binding protein